MEKKIVVFEDRLLFKEGEFTNTEAVEWLSNGLWFLYARAVKNKNYVFVEDLIKNMQQAVDVIKEDFELNKEETQEKEDDK